MVWEPVKLCKRLLGFATTEVSRFDSSQRTHETSMAERIQTMVVLGRELSYPSSNTERDKGEETRQIEFLHHQLGYLDTLARRIGTDGFRVLDR